MRGLKTSILASVCVLALGGTALADDSEVETVTVTGTRNPEPVETFPGMVNVLDLDDIQAHIPSTVADLFVDIPNMQFVGGPRRTGESPNIRGFGGQDVLILIDGVRQSWTSGHDGRFFLDPGLLAGAEVVRGPNSALYGSGALGGVIAFRTADAADFLGEGETAGLRAAFGYQDVDDEFLRSVTGFTHLGDFDFIANIGERSSGDIKLGSGALLPSDDDIVTGFVKAGYDFGDGLNAKIIYQGFQNDVVEPLNGQGISVDGLANKTVTFQQVSGEIDWKPAAGGFIDMHLVPYHSEGEVEEIDPTTHERTFRNIETNGLSLDNRTPFSFANVSGLFTFGGEWYEDDQKGFDSAGVGGMRSGVPDGEDSFWGVFAQIEANVDQPLGAPGKLTVIPAIRYDSYDTSSSGNPDTHKDQFSPKLAATYAPNDWLFVFGNVGEAFRAPGINELYLEGVHFSVPHPILPGVIVSNFFLPNPNLKPETSSYWEAGGGLTFHDFGGSGGTLNVKASYWNQSVDDFINLSVFLPETFYSLGCFTPPFTIDCNLGYTTSVNVNAELHGAEIEAVYDTDRVRLQADYGTITGKQRGTPYALTSLMPDIFGLVATLKIPEADATLNARLTAAASYSHSYDPISSDPSSEMRDGYTVVDLYATWAPSSEVLGGHLHGLRIDAGVDNVADEAYEPYQQGVVAPGRNLKILASYTYTW